MSDPTYWFLNKPPTVEAAGLDAYLASGEWHHPNSTNQAKDLATMESGDRVALRLVVNRAAGLPFFNADRPVSTMTVFATGTVIRVDAEQGRVAITWGPANPREWYFYTRWWATWKIDLDSSPRARQLIDFAFGGQDQDLDSFLADEFWADRYAPWPKFSWIPFYQDFASRLVQFQSDRSGLVSILSEAAESEPLLGYLSHDKYPGGEFGPLEDVDPFTVMGTFNRGVTQENRQAIAARLGKALGVSAPIPEDFAGIPVLNNQNSWFMSYAMRREPDDIDKLWTVFSAGLALAEEDNPAKRSALVSAYDKAKSVRGIRWNLSVGLYWIRPERFMTLDSRSREFIHRKYGLEGAASGADYLDVCDNLLETFADSNTTITSFPLLSFAAWMGDAGEGHVPHTVAGMATWCSRFAESSDLNASEHEYKRKAAALARKARDEALSGDASWLATLKTALNATNTVDFRFKDTLNKAISADRNAGLRVLDTIWSAPTVDRLDDLQEALRGFIGKVTPGNATALGALLLMSEDGEDNAPYSASRTERWYQLTGTEPPEPAGSASARYSTMIDFLDALRSELASRADGLEASRLEVQGMAWATTEAPPPADWDEQESQALIEWRGREEEAPRAWLARGKTPVIDWVEGDYVSLAASYLGSPAPGASVAEVKAAIASGYQHQDTGQRKALVVEYYAFLSVMKPGDIVAALHDGRLHVGVVDGPAEYEEQDGDRLRRAVLWQTAVPTGDLSSSVSYLLDRQGNIVDVTEGLTDLQAILEISTAVVESGRLALPAVGSDLADELFMPQPALQEIIDLLDARKQIVLYGPPGTGKSFVAKALARHIIGTDDPSRMQLVQFHPSYAYEDFFEGYRPSETESGQASFTLQEGPLARIAREARADKSHPYVLVIDEMNRANLAKVFGELYFLLEYRNESMQLQYRPTEAFRLPENLFIIGTMNTADRSIALLDAAMRRRFSFVELHPDEEPVKGVLPAWLAQGDHDLERAHLLQALNDAIEDQDRDLRIGPSYLMREEASTEEGLRRIWKYDVMPLLEEHYYGRLTRDQIHSRFGLDALRGQVGAVSTTDPIQFEADDLFTEDSSA